MRPNQCKDCPNVHIVPNENKNRTRYYCAATGKRGGKYKPIVKTVDRPKESTASGTPLGPKRREN